MMKKGPPQFAKYVQKESMAMNQKHMGNAVIPVIAKIAHQDFIQIRRGQMLQNSHKYAKNALQMAYVSMACFTKCDGEE